ncbi:hypothetical protein ACFQ9Z_11735 [Streptomyces sp. NPDC056580]|uniref:hypothetical protein n=1 Tax=Streptomyces sp. NPDC056580 TaxID=3345872 RepID=UPI0036BE9066
MQKIAALAATTLATATLLSGTAHTAQARPLPADPHPPTWDKTVHCSTTDPDGRRIVTRFGNSEFGWYHFTTRHNIKKCSTIAAAVHGNVDRNDHQGRLEYDGVAFETGPRPRQVKFTVVVQYTRKSKDRRYDAGRGQTIGVINAFCRNQRNNKCPAWMHP